MKRSTLDYIEITILNWEKFNPRKDVKHSTWFRMQDTLFDHPDMLSFTSHELLMWVYILCLASKKNSNSLVVHVLHAQRVGRLRSDYIESSIEKLKQIKAITYKYVTHTSRLRNEHVTRTSRLRVLRNVTERNETQLYIGPDPKVPDPTQKVDFDFEALYQKYPKRIGHQRKSDGIRLCKSKFTTQKKYDSLSKSINNYSEYCVRENKVGTEFVTQFKTFVGKIWEEWVNPEKGLSNGHTNWDQIEKDLNVRSTHGVEPL